MPLAELAGRAPRSGRRPAAIERQHGNEASRRTAARAGYRYEGLLRSHQEIGGRRSDKCR